MAPAFLTRLLRALRIRRDGRGAAPARENPRPESERLWLALEAGAIGVGEVDIRSGEARLTANWRKICGFGADERVSKRDLDALVHEDDVAAFRQAQADSLDPRGARHFLGRFRIRRRNDGALRWVKTRGNIHFEGAVPIRMIGVLRDITDEIEAAEALAERAGMAEQARLRADELHREQQRLALALEAGSIGTFDADLVADETRFSEKHREIFGLTHDVALTTAALDALVVEEDRAAMREARARALAENGCFRVRYRIRRANDGALRHCDTRGQVYFLGVKPVRVYGVTRDVTDEMAAAAAVEERARLAEQERLRAAERAREQQRLALALEAGAIGAFEVDLADDSIRLSEKHLEICGLTCAQPVRLTLLDSLIVDEDRAAVYETRARALNGAPRYQMRFRIRRANDGALRWIDTRGEVLFEGGAPVGVFGVTRDITDEIEAAAALEERAGLAEQARLRAEELALEKQRLALALEGGAIGAFEADLVRNEIHISDKLRDIWGWSGASPVRPGDLDALVLEEDRAAREAARARVREDNGRYRARFRIRRGGDGAVRWLDTRSQVFFDEGAPTHVLGVTRDITDEMQAAAALEDRARLAEQDRHRADQLAQEQRRLALALEAGAIGTFEADLIRDVVRLNEKHREICGLKGDEPVRVAALNALVIEEDRAARDAARRRAWWDNGRYRARFRIRRANDGALRWLDTHGHVTFDGVTPVRVLGVARDITDEMAVAATLEEKARLSEQLTLLAEALPGAVYSYVLAADGSRFFTYASSNVQKLLGFGPALDELDVSMLAARVPDDDLVQMVEARDVSRRDLGPWRATFRYDHPERGEIWIAGDSQPVRRDDGATVWHGYLQDVTARETAARALAESEARVRALKDERLAALEDKAKLAEQLSLLAEALPGAVCSYVLAADGTRSFTYASSNVRKLLGFGPALHELDLSLISAQVRADDLPQLLARRDASRRDLGTWRGTFRYNHPERGEIWISGDSQPVRRDDGATVWHGYLQDVTARETAARALAESEARVRALKDERLAALEDKARLAEQLTLLANTLPGAIYTFVRRPDGSAYLSYAAPQIETLLGAGPDIYGGDFMTLASRVHIADMQGFNDPDATETARAQKVWRAVFRYAHPDKGEIWLEGHARAAPREDGGLVWHGYLQDVTARETVARALTESEARRLTALEDKARLAERLSLLAEALPGAIGAYVRPAQGDSHFSYVSPNVERLTGFSPSVCQHDLPRVIARIHPEDFRNIMIAEAASARDCSRWNEVFRYNHPERGEIWIQGDGQPVRRDDGATMWHGYFQDVTEREAAARDLAESEARVRALKDERLALLEKMAVRLAHEVNQPLAAGATLLAVARRKIDPPHPGGAQYADLNGACEAVDKAARQLLRAGRIVTRMREFSRHGEPDKTFRSLHETIRETIDSLKSFSSLAAFEIVTRLDAARDRVLIDRVQITQVLVNLIQNARQAALYEGPRTIVVASRNHDREIHISVIDYGSGLSEDARRHLFELFWTTKSSGMGVGLATARAIVEAHYGTIWARESSAEGTVFTFSLPLVEGSDFPGELE